MKNKLFTLLTPQKTMLKHKHVLYSKYPKYFLFSAKVYLTVCLKIVINWGSSDFLMCMRSKPEWLLLFARKCKQLQLKSTINGSKNLLVLKDKNYWVMETVTLLLCIKDWHLEKFFYTLVNWSWKIINSYCPYLFHHFFLDYVIHNILNNCFSCA